MERQDWDLVYDSPASISHHCESAPLARDDSISALLLNHVQQLRFEINIHFINAGLTRAECRLLRTLAKPDVCLGTVQETTSSAPIPLSLRKADHILWGGMMKYHTSEPGGPRKVIAVRIMIAAVLTLVG